MEGRQERADFGRQVPRRRRPAGRVGPRTRRGGGGASRRAAQADAESLMHDVIIIGAGPAGLSAALWCDELGLDTLVVEREGEVGGQLLRVHNPVENYLGVRAANGR